MTGGTSSSSSKGWLELGILFIYGEEEVNCNWSRIILFSSYFIPIAPASLCVQAFFRIGVPFLIMYFQKSFVKSLAPCKEVVVIDRKVIQKEKDKIEDNKSLKKEDSFLDQDLKDKHLENDKLIRKIGGRLKPFSVSTVSVDSRQKKIKALETALEKIEEFKKKKGITREIKFIVHPTASMAAYDLYFHNGIFFSIKDLIETQENNEFDAVLAHEFSHIVNKDTYMPVIISCFYQIACLFIRNKIINMVTVFLFIEFFHLIFPKISCANEKRADLDSVELADNARGMCHFFERMIEKNKKEYNEFVEKGKELGFFSKLFRSSCKYSAEGNNLRDYYHPPLTERVQYLTPFIRPEPVVSTEPPALSFMQRLRRVLPF
jgi:hypothetical protein